MKTIVINAVEVCRSNPKKQEYLSERWDEFCTHIFEDTGDTVKYAAVYDAEAETMKRILNQLPDIELVPYEESYGLLMQDPTAARLVFFGQKARPFPLEQWPDNDVKIVNPLVYMDGYPDNLLELMDPVLLKDCPLQTLTGISARLAEESCGKCVFCREGIGQIAAVFQDIETGRGVNGDLEQIKKLCRQIMQQVICPIGVSGAKLIETCLDENYDEVQAHITKKVCHAVSCKNFVWYKILGSKCTGCGACMEACEEEAISGKANYIHIISERDCIKCGKCLNVCQSSAVVCCSEKKPVCPIRPMPVGSWKR